MKRLVMTVAISCVLCASAKAGDVPSVPAPQPPSEQTQGLNTTTTGDMPNGGYTSEDSSSAFVSVLQLILGVLAA